jgi:hypothetical protein
MARLSVAICLYALLMAGCLGGPAYAPPPGVPMAGGPMPTGPMEPQFVLQNNPVFVPVQDPNLIWDQLIDVVDDYFEVEREDRVRLVGDILTEGRVDTFPKVASTIFEPWNRDSVTFSERWQATLQSMRRQATIRVIPAEGGFLVDVNVQRELEDVASPDAVVLSDNDELRNDNSIRRFGNRTPSSGQSLGWINKGHDIPLEQEIILQLQARFAPPGTPGAPMFIGTNSPNPPATTPVR